MRGAPQPAKQNWRRVTVSVLVMCAGIQAIPAGKTNPPVTRDFRAATAAPPSEATLLRAACNHCQCYTVTACWLRIMSQRAQAGAFLHHRPTANPRSPEDLFEPTERVNESRRSLRIHV